LEAQDRQKCPFKDGNVVAILLTIPCSLSSGHPWLILFDQNPPLMGISTLYEGWDTALSARKYPVFI